MREVNESVDKARRTGHIARPMPSAKPAAYYNEFDPYAGEWLRNLIAKGLIADGVVDTRSIVDVRPDDLKGFTQAHWFAGIGGWSLALRLAGVADSEPVWTGSCPCQGFSAAGKGAGFADPRHLWPDWFRLIRECHPSVVFGEQVASPLALAWLDLVHADMEGEGYAVAANDLCAAGVGAPHIRQRLWFVADADVRGLEAGREGCSPVGYGSTARPDLRTGELADAHDARSQGRGGMPERADQCAVRALGMAGGLGDAEHNGSPAAGQSRGTENERRLQQSQGPNGGNAAGPTNGPWGTADWLLCRDGKWRPVESGTFPLAHGIPGRVGRLRAYGNAIVPQVAAEFISAYLACRP